MSNKVYDFDGAAALASAEANIYRQALVVTNGNKLRAAIVLGVSRGTLHKKIVQHNIVLTTTAVSI